MSRHTQGACVLGPHNSILGGPPREMKGGRVIQDQLFMPCAQEWMEKGEPEANARRLVACWNYCQGLDTEGMERAVSIGDAAVAMRDRLITETLAVTERRDELLSALKAFTAAQDAKRAASGKGADLIAAAISALIIAEEKACAAIAKVEKGHD